MSARCKSCAAPIIWCITTAGVRMPIDAQPAAGGNIFITNPDERPWVVSVISQKKDNVVFMRGAWGILEPGTLLYSSHFRTCPNAAQHRKAKP